MRIFAGVIAVSALCLPNALSAQTAAAPTDDGTGTAESVPSTKKICKSFKVTGSRLSKQRVCATQMDWDRYDRETEEKAREMVDNPSSVAPPPS